MMFLLLVARGSSNMLVYLRESTGVLKREVGGGRIIREGGMRMENYQRGR